ncbi:ATP-dependent RNA helicase DOB1 [Nematocida homosporus]|uniref:ATP-dependent RNA helicase DOB1 n=1 Tax=Nematocida homosporus TaxID=1912981 RepID=UPI0022205E40|nr:ATP-dependent RNA helicase DOB1 [Nematocida homosporus]KAI5185104.1 ATP-dependent RNA helicase DOB1 [Nematocida homosporus]
MQISDLVPNLANNSSVSDSASNVVGSDNSSNLVGGDSNSGSSDNKIKSNSDNKINTGPNDNLNVLDELGEFLDDAEEIDSFVETADKNAVRHFCIAPRAFPYLGLASSTMEIRCTYPFQLDRFQELALQCLERDESVLVSAHTSAGKTLIAEYAIHLSILRKQRVIYTSPIKALSNQKYRELNEKFGDVGLMTGDVTLNPDSTCIVMTTEILRNMIYRGTEILRETHFVVFDEVHYMRDRERGVVWEESIILLPSSIRFIFLSATIPNAAEFARWIVSIHKQPCHVIYTEKRPTPLEHYIYSNQPGRKVSVRSGQSLVGVSDKVFLVVDKDGVFQNHNFMRIPKDQNGDTRKNNRSNYNRRRESINVVEIINILQATKNLPTIVFSFRRKECESYAIAAKEEFDFNTSEEKELIETIFSNALNSLREEDRKLEQITGLKSMLHRGIGVHHSGLLPIVKEIIEILFQENLLKVLFATETFSIGLNMPAKSVVFTSIKKFDGVSTRFVTSGEYIQMSGRAGRRGTDKIGNVILALESGTSVSEQEIKKVLHGPSNPLDSAFRLSYNTILNILRLDGMDEEYIIKHSFLQFRQEIAGKTLFLEVVALSKGLSEITEQYTARLAKLEGSKEIMRFFRLKLALSKAASLLFPEGVLSTHLAPGRVVMIRRNVPKEETFGSCKVSYPDLMAEIKEEPAVVFVFKNNQLQVIGESGRIEEVLLSAVVKLSKKSVPIDRHTSVAKVVKTYFDERKKRKMSETLPDLQVSPSEWCTPKDFGLPDEIDKNLQAMSAQCEVLRQEFIMNRSKATRAEIKLLAREYALSETLQRTVQELKVQVQKTRLVMIDEYNNKRKILQALSYVVDRNVLIKGKVASEISSGDELLLTEMLFNNEFSKLSAGRICSLLSCVVFDEKSDDFTLSTESQAAYTILKTTVDRLVGEFQRIDPQFVAKEYIEKFCPKLMDVVYRWTEGYSFAEICSTTDVFEGSVIRCFRRLEEVLKEMCRASKLIGNVEMENKFSAAISLVKRDIVFANSLYL